MKKDTIKLYLSVCAFTAAVIIGFIALFVPPTGIIDASVLWFTSQMLVFTATLLGFDMTIDNVRQVIKGKGNPNNIPEHIAGQPTPELFVDELNQDGKN